MAVDSIYSGGTGLDAVLAGQTTPVETQEDPLGRDAFLTMLVAQLKNQDPLNPMESTDFTAQLAQFSNLEQMFQVNDTLEGIQGIMNTRAQDNVIDYIGKQVTCEDDVLIKSDDSSMGGFFTIDAPAEAEIIIYDSLGQEVRRIFAGHLDAGTYGIEWDGKDNQGISAADGAYQFEVIALDDNGGMVPARKTITGTVTGVTYENGLPYLLVEDVPVSASAVTDVRMPPESDDSDPASS